MGEIVGFSKDEKEEIVKQSVLFWQAAEQAQRPFFDIVNEFERLARVLLPEKLASVYESYSDRSALVPPDIYNNLNSLRAHIRKAVFGRKPFIRLSIAGKPGLRNEVVEKMEQVLQSIMDQESEGKGFSAESDKAIYQALYAGLTVVYTSWEKKVIRRVRRDEDFQIVYDPKTKVPIFDENFVVAEYPETKSLDIRRCRIDPSAAERKDIRIVGYHSLSQLNELIVLNRANGNNYDFDEQELRDSSFHRTEYFEYDKSEADAYSEKSEINQGFGSRHIEVWSIRGLYRFEKPDGTMEWKDLFVEIGNRTVLLSLKINDLPLHGWELFDFPAIDEQHGRLYTMGVVEPVRDTFIEQFIKRNQSLDSANRNVYNTYIGDSGACAEIPEYIEASNDQIIRLDLMASGLTDVRQALSVLDRPPLGQDTFMHAQTLSRTTQQTMRMSDYLQGINPSSTETATAVSEVVAGGRSLTDHLMEKLRDTYFAPVAIKKLILWNFFMADKESTITGADGRIFKVEAGELNFPFEASIETNIASTAPAMIRRFVEALPLLLNDPYWDQRVVRETMVQMLDLPNGVKLLRNREYAKVQVERENAALMYGIQLPVHDLDEHRSHIEGHVEALDFVEQRREKDPNLRTETLEEHIAEHQEMLEQQTAALSNTKEIGGGAAVQPDAAASRASAGKQATGNFMPREKRR